MSNCNSNHTPIANQIIVPLIWSHTLRWSEIHRDGENVYMSVGCSYLDDVSTQGENQTYNLIGYLSWSHVTTRLGGD